jgi:hypothetical protein
VYGVTWNPHVLSPCDLVFTTWGKKHCKLWWQHDEKHASSAWASKQLSFGRFGLQNVHSAVFLPVSHALVLGLARGDLLIFSGNCATCSIAAHRPGPQFIADDGSISHSGVRGLALHKGNTVLLSAGAPMHV